MAKGGGYERDFCKRLSLWWSGGESDSVFWRTSNSGGRATVRHRKSVKTKNQHGDVCATDPSGQSMIDAFCIELKRGYSRSTLFDLLDKGPKAKIQQHEAWIGKTIRSCEAAGTMSWMLVTRRDQRREFIVLPKGTWMELKGAGFARPIPFVSCQVLVKGNDGRNDSIKLVGMLLEDWLKIVKPENVKRMVENERNKDQAWR